MAISFNKALGSYESAMLLRSERSAVLANNIANADTPGYQARDMNFQDVLKARMGQASGNSLPLATPDTGHAQNLIQPDAINGLQYRTPSQPSIDGNTVDLQVERAEFARNTLEYQAAFTLLNGRINGLRAAIRGD